MTNMSSPSLPPQSEDELFNPTRGGLPDYETVETVPVNRMRSSPDLDTLASLPNIHNEHYTQRGGLDSQIRYGQNASRSQYITQPTQIIDRVLSDAPSPPSNHIVQVAASSPVATPGPAARKPTGILASAMAPAGTAFRKPYVAPVWSSKQKPVLIDSDDEDRAVSSDSDRAERARNNIKTSTFKRATDKVPESPEGVAGLSRFQQITQGSLYRANNHAQGTKRSSDTMANAYGNVSKKPRQVGPSRAVPVTTHGQDAGPDIDQGDIVDPNERSKVRRMGAIYPGYRNSDMLSALRAKKGNFEDAVEHLMVLSEQKAKRTSNAIDLTGSEDELMMTPAMKKKTAPVPVPGPVPSIQDTRQQAKKPTQSINQKWSSTQAISRKPSSQNKKLDVFEDPGPAAAKPRKLIRGRREPSPPSKDQPKKASQDKKKTAIEISDGSDDDDAAAGAVSEPDDNEFSTRLLSFFNTCSAMDLADTASISRDIAEHFVSKRPFRSIDAVTRIENPNAKPTKSKRKAAPFGERIVDKVDEMLRSYEAVDYLVKKCETIAKPLTNEMKNWGVDIFGKSGSGELDMTSLGLDTQQSGGSHDSGLGTPISDDDHDSIRAFGSKKFVGQPVSMAEGIVMKDYQVVGVNWLSLLYRKRYSCILADDMGLGKTLQTIAFVAHLAETGVHGPHLIVVPAATLENWLKEFARFCPSLRVEPYYAPNPTERFEMREMIDEDKDEINVIVTTYTIAKAKDDFPWLKSFGFCCTIFDEGHMLKNADSKVSRSLMRIRSQWRLLLTGTPLQNNLKELMSLLSFLMPDIFKQKQDELETIFKQDVKTINEEAENREMLLSKERIARARSMLTPFILRRKKWQVLKDLPKKERKLEYCEMNDAQEAIYNGWLAKAYDIRERRARGENIVVSESTNILMKLRQAAIHPLLFRHRYQDENLRNIAKACLKDPQWAESNPKYIMEELVHYSDFEVHQLCVKSAALQKFRLQKGDIAHSGKVQAMLKLLKQFISEGHRTLIFSQFVLVLDILEVVLSAQGIKFFRLDGNTKVTERQDLIDEFNEEINETSPDAAQRAADRVPVFMLSTKAGGAGINLASASRVIIFDSGFNPQDDVQAENRAHRIGQKREVEVWRLVTKGSVEEQIYGMGMVKLRLDREVAGEGAEDGEAATGKAADKKNEEKENEGMKEVEDLFFKKLDQTPRKPSTEAKIESVEPEPAVQAAEINDVQEIDLKEEDNASSTEIEKDQEASSLQADATRPQSPDDSESSAKPKRKSSQRSKASSQHRQDDDVTLAGRSKASRPKAGSRKGSSQSQSQSRSQSETRPARGKVQSQLSWGK